MTTFGTGGFFVHMKSLATTEVLYEVINAISSLSIEELLTKVDVLVQRITDADSTGIYTLDEVTQSVVLRASKLHFSIINTLKMPIGEGITGWVARHGETVVLEERAREDSRFARVQELPDDLYESFLSVPIKSGDIIIGVINVKHERSHLYPHEQVKLLEMVGKLIGHAIDHALLLEKTKNLHDALETQKVVTRAKGMLMERLHLSENEAYHLLRKKATKERKSMKEIAEAILLSSDVLT